MAIRMTGLNSGLNTESIVAALMSAQRTKQTKIENKKTKLEWKQEVWSSLNTKIYDFYKNSLAKIRMQSNYRTKAATSSNTSKVTATASSNAATGNYAIKVKQIASAQNVTSGKLQGAVVRDKDGNIVKDDNGNDTYNTVTSQSKLTDLRDANGEITFKAGDQIKIEVDNKKVYLDIDSNTTVQNFLDKLKNVGLNATFDEKQQRLFISSNKSGEGNSFKITAGQLSGTDAATAIKDLKDFIGYSSLSSSNKTIADNIMAGLVNGTKTILDDDVVERFTEFANNKKQADAKETATNFYTEVAKKEVAEELEKQTFEGAGDTSGLTEEEKYKKYAEYLNKNNYKIDTSQSADKIKENVDAIIELEAKKLLKKDEYKTKISDAVENGISEETIKKELNLSGNETDYNDIKKKYFVEDSMTRARNTLVELPAKLETYSKQISSINGAFDNSNGSILRSLGLANVTGENVEEDPSSSGMAVVKAKDTEIVYNGATLTSDTTNISIAGLELNILSETGDETVNISVTNDTSAIYDTIKDFITEYNSILKEMNKYYGADSAKGYDVLTDEEKEAMSESEVEKWESKIKDSLLRRDTTLSGIVSSFRNNMMGMVTASNGKKYALSSLGITSSADYAEGGLLHIKGDEDDSEYADYENTLKKLLEEDPNTVMEVLTKLSDNLYQDLQKKMSSTKLSGAFTFYNDKEMASQLSDYKKDISTWQDKLNDIEDRYYKQFTAMEKALANLQSQQNSLANLLGG